MREVNALSRLNHRFIVRYYTTWIETVEAPSTTASDDSSAGSSTASTEAGSTPTSGHNTDDDETDSEEATNTTSGPSARAIRRRSGQDELFLPVNGGFGLDIEVDDFDEMDDGSQSSFPSIHFEGSQSPPGSDSSLSGDEGEGDDIFDTLFTPGTARQGEGLMPGPLTRTLYIQMVGLPCSEGDSVADESFVGICGEADAPRGVCFSLVFGRPVLTHWV